MIRTFLIFFVGGLVLTTAAISLSILGSAFWLHCLNDDPRQTCADAMFFAVASPFYSVILAMGVNFLPLVVGATLAVIGRAYFRRVPLWLVIAILPACVLAYVVQGWSWYPQTQARPLSERLLVFSALMMPCLMACWWWDRRAR